MTVDATIHTTCDWEGTRYVHYYRLKGESKPVANWTEPTPTLCILCETELYWASGLPRHAKICKDCAYLIQGGWLSGQSS